MQATTRHDLVAPALLAAAGPDPRRELAANLDRPARETQASFERGSAGAV